MRADTFSLATITALLLTLNTVHRSAAQIVGCDGEGIGCSTNDKNAKGICQPKLTNDGIGIVSFDSNIISNDPLTWTLTTSDQKTAGEEYTDRSIWLGTPPSLNVSNISDFGGCSVSMGNNITNALQLPPGFSGFEGFGSGNVMGESCVQDLVLRVRQELDDIMQDCTRDGHTSPCTLIVDRLQGTQLPSSCGGALRTQGETTTNQYLFKNAMDIISKDGFGHQLQDGCVVTTGGPEYLVNFGPAESEFGKPESDQIKLFKNGTTPLFTLFYNEPWNNASTGRVSFLDDPEVHLSCLTIAATTADSTSGSVQTTATSTGLILVWLLVFASIWVSFA